MTTELINFRPPAIEPISLRDEAKELKELALNGAALIGKVTNAESNDAAVNAQRELKRVIALFEKSRKAQKEPLLEAGRRLDNFVKAESEELDKEFGRISVLVTEFALAEQARVREEQRLQQAELDRIEREKFQELKRIAAEAAAKEAEVKKITDAVEREAAMKRLDAEQAKQQSAAIESAKDKAIIEARPIAATRSEGQIIKTDWEIQVTNPYELAKFHPDCVLEVKPALAQIKSYLNQGMTIRGISAKKVTTASVKHSSRPALIEV